MALTVKHLKELIASGRNPEAIITDQQGRDITHMRFDIEQGDLILSTEAPIGECNRTGAQVYPSEVEGYTAYCPELDEDLYDFEFIPFVNTNQHKHKQKTEWIEAVADYEDNNGVLHIDVYKDGEKDGRTAAYVFNGQVYYTDPEFRYVPVVADLVRHLIKS